jgi:hypothetical protein
MAEDPGFRTPATMKENPLVARLIAKGVDGNARVLRGFIGPSRGDDRVTVYPRLDLADCFEVARSDILHHEEAPRSRLGAVILWVRKGAPIAIRRLESSVAGRAAGASAGDFREVRRGRLRMRVRADPRDDTCFSTCMDCASLCEPGNCVSLCSVEQ